MNNPLLPALLLATAAPTAPPLPVAIAPQAPPSMARPGPAMLWPDSLPHVRLRILSQPDWSDYNVYPPAARALEQEGSVTPEVLIGIDGTPLACRIVWSSGYAELDSGTCDLMLQMRFAPPRDDVGRDVQTSYSARLIWGLSDPTPFGPARVTARLTIDHEKITTCALDASGSVPAEWRKLACPTITHEPAYYLASDARLRATQALVVIEVRPAGTPAAPPPPRTRLVAQRVTDFQLTHDGAIHECRTSRNEGFGAPRTDHQGPCGFFLVKPWFEPDPAGPIPATGTIEVSVYLPAARTR